MKVLVSGGAGFIGANAAHKFLKSGYKVRVLDDCSRDGVENNLKWLANSHADRLEIIKADVRDEDAVRRAVDGMDVVCHFAAQVAVTDSIKDPRGDNATNVGGTLNILEAARETSSSPMVIFTSTNKVYGGLQGVGVTESDKRYVSSSHPEGVDEAQPLDFHSPYGCSKGAADQYVLDYSRVFGLNTVVLRMSCIYGERQYGTEDQGWIAHFSNSWLRRDPVCIYGDGKQVRDALHVSDLVRVLERLIGNIGTFAGEVFNIGGGTENAISVLELTEMLHDKLTYKTTVSFDEWRSGDQRLYVTNISKARRLLSWSPEVSVTDGVDRLLAWQRSL